MFRTEPMNATLIAMKKLFNLILLSAFVAFAVVACSKDDDDEVLNNKEVVDNGNNDNGDKDNTNNGNTDSDKDNNGSDNGNDNGDVDNGDGNGDVNNGDEENNGGSNNDGGDNGNGYDPTNGGRFVGPLAWMYEGYKKLTDYDKEWCNLWFDRLGSLESTYHNGTYYVNTETYLDGTMAYNTKLRGIGYHLITLDEWDVIRERFIHGYYSLVPLNKTIYVEPWDSDEELYDLVDNTLVWSGLADEPTIIIHNIIGEAPYWINETRQQGLKLACFHRPYPKELPWEWDLIYINENDLNNKEQRYPLIFIDEYGDYRRGGQQ